MSLRGDSSATVLAVQRVSRGTKEVKLDENEAGGQPKNQKVQFELSRVDSGVARLNCAEKVLTFR